MKLLLNALIIASFALPISANSSPNSVELPKKIECKCKENTETSFEIINIVGVLIGSIGESFPYLGATNTPSLQNPFVEGLLGSTSAQVYKAVEDVGDILKSLEYDQANINLLQEKLFAYYNSAIQYCLTMNAKNTFDPSANEAAATQAFFVAAVALGNAINQLTNNTQAIETLTYVTILWTQNAQAWRGCLISPDYQANPENPTTEAIAAVKIGLDIQFTLLSFIAEQICIANKKPKHHKNIKWDYLKK